MCYKILQMPLCAFYVAHVAALSCILVVLVTYRSTPFNMQSAVSAKWWRVIHDHGSPSKNIVIGILLTCSWPTRWSHCPGR